MNDPSKATQNDKIVALPDAEERARRLRVEVERLSRLPTVEWLFYLPDIAKKHGIEDTRLKQMIEAVIKAAEKQAREDRGELRRAEKQRAWIGHRQKICRPPGHQENVRFLGCRCIKISEPLDPFSQTNRLEIGFWRRIRIWWCWSHEKRPGSSQK